MFSKHFIRTYPPLKRFKPIDKYLDLNCFAPFSLRKIPPG